MPFTKCFHWFISFLITSLKYTHLKNKKWKQNTRAYSYDVQNEVKKTTTIRTVIAQLFTGGEKKKLTAPLHVKEQME